MFHLDTFQTALQGCKASDVGESRINEGSRVLLPSTALDEISRLNVTYPLQFRIETHSGRHVFAAVLEFDAERGKIVLPDWMFTYLKLKGRPILQLRTVTLPAGNIMKLQPHNHAFIQLKDPRLVLEQRLVNYTVLTSGTTIEIKYAGKTFKLDIVEILSATGNPLEAVLTARADAQATELKVEFDRPLDMPPSPRGGEPAPTPTATNIVGSSNAAGVQFKPFHFVPPSLTDGQPGATTSSGDTTAEPKSAPVEGEAQAPSFVAFTGTGRPLGGSTQPGGVSAAPAPASATPLPEEVRQKRLAALAARAKKP